MAQDIADVAKKPLKPKKDVHKQPVKEDKVEPEKVKFKKPKQRELEKPAEVEVVTLKKHAFEPLPLQEEVNNY